MGVRGRLVRLGPTLDEILGRHDYPDLVSHLLGEAVASYGGSVLRAFAEVETALADGVWLARQSEAVAHAASQAARARDLARQRYQAGLADFLVVNDSQRQAFATQSASITVQRLRIDNRIDLILALGGGFVTEPPNLQTTP